MTEPLHGLYEMPNADYHAHPALSSTGMKTLLKAPAKYAWEREHKVFTNSFDFGSAWHAAVLDDSNEALVVIDADSWRTNDAREQRDQARDEGKIPVLTKDYTVIEDMVAALRDHAEASALLDLKHGDVEVSAFWNDERTGTPLRARFDYLPHADHPHGFTVVDPKTCASSEPWKWLKSAFDYGYPIQDALYRRAARHLGLDPRPDFAFVCQEKEPPYIVSVIRLDAESRAIGDHLIDKAIDRYVECSKSGDWSGGYVDDVYTGSLPGFITAQFEGVI